MPPAVTGKWLDRYPILDPDHIHDLETRAALGEFHYGLPRHDAEAKAHGDYKKDQLVEAAVHHLVGLRASHAAGDMDSAKKHGAMYELACKAMGHGNPVKPPPEVEQQARNTPPTLTRFKAHKGDLFSMPEPKEEMAKAEPDHVDLERHVDDENVETKLFRNKAGEHCVRIHDLDAGETVGIYKHPTKERAKAHFDKLVGAQGGVAKTESPKGVEPPWRLDERLRKAETLGTSGLEKAKSDTRNLTEDVAQGRQTRVLQNWGLQPQVIPGAQEREDAGKGAFPFVREGNGMPFVQVTGRNPSDLPGIQHEGGHAATTQIGQTLAENQTRINKLNITTDRTDDDVADRIGHLMNRRAGVRSGPSRFTPEAHGGELEWELGDQVRTHSPAVTHEVYNAYPEHPLKTGAKKDYLAGVDKQARAHIDRFDQGAKFDEKGLLHGPSGIDNTVNTGKGGVNWLRTLLRKAEPLEKRSKNVREQTRNLSDEQTENRQLQYARSIGLDPQHGRSNENEFPKTTANRPQFDATFALRHEIAHPIMTGPGQTAAEHEAEITSGTNWPGQHDEIVAMGIEPHIDKRAGIAHRRRRSDAPPTILPKSLQGIKSRDYPAAVQTEAKKYIERFDEGARFDSTGRLLHAGPDDESQNQKVNRGHGGVDWLRKLLHKSEPLEKRSKNVRIQTRNISRQQAEQRHVQYGKKIGLDPVKDTERTMDQSYDSGSFPTPVGNKVPFNTTFPAQHEISHALDTGYGQTVGAHTKKISNSIPGVGLEPNNEWTATLGEREVGKRAGVGSKLTKDPLKVLGSKSLGNSIRMDPAYGVNRKAAAENASKFDQGAHFDQEGTLHPPSGVDHAINARAKAGGPGWLREVHERHFGKK